MDKEEYINRLKGIVSEKRLQHSLAVAEVSVSLAARFGVDSRRVELAGLLHDYARDIPGERLIEIAQNRGLVVTCVEKNNPVLLHGPVGAVLVKADLGISDPEVLKAVARHTVGGPEMSPLEMIVYVADMIEPGRRFPGVEELRRKAEKDLSGTVLLAADRGLSFFLQKRRLIHPATIEMRNWLLSKQP